MITDITKTPDDEPEEIELEPRLAASVPFVKTSPAPARPAGALRSISSPVPNHVSTTTPPLNHLRTPVDSRRSIPLSPKANGRPASSPRLGARPGSSCLNTVDFDARSLSVFDAGGDRSRRPSALDILSCAGSEGAMAAVERAKERRKIVVFMSTISHILLYVLPTLIVLCLILYWTIPNGEDHKWLTMLAAILGCACVLDFAIYQYFTNRREGTGFNNTLAKFRARLKRSGRRF